jgi:hypothetical protein
MTCHRLHLSGSRFSSTCTNPQSRRRTFRTLAVWSKHRRQSSPSYAIRLRRKPIGLGKSIGSAKRHCKTRPCSVCRIAARHQVFKLTRHTILAEASCRFRMRHCGVILLTHHHSSLITHPNFSQPIIMLASP